MNMRYIFIAFLVAGPAMAAEPALAIRNATIETLAKDGRLEKATLVIRNGKVEAVGKDVAIPDDARVIDAAGGTMMPGFIDPMFEVPVAAPTADASPRTITVGNRTIPIPGGGNPAAGGFTRIADNFYPYAPGYKPLPRVGLTRLNLITNGSGQSAVIRVTPQQPDHMMDRADGPAFVSITNSTTSLDQLRSRLEGGRGGAGGGPPGGGRPGGGRLGGGAFGGFGGGATAGAQLWADVKEGKAPLIVTAANSAAIVHVLKLVEPHEKVKLTIFASGSAFAEAADVLKGRNVRAIVYPELALVPNTRDRFAPVRLLHELGVEVALSLTGKGQNATEGGPTSGDEIAGSDFPLFGVAMMVKFGLPRQTALEALTKKPAMILGLEATHGTIEPGKVADLVLFTGDPLDPSSRLRMLLIDGRMTHASE